MHNQGVPLGDIAEHITKQAETEGCPDNMTLVLVDLRQYYNQHLL